MRQKLIFEEIANELVFQPRFWVKWLIGGALSFIPIVNILAFGYLYRFSVQSRRTGKMALPEWGDWSRLFADGVKFTVIWIVYWALPLLLAFMLAMFLSSIGLYVMAHLLISATFFLTSVFFCAALYRFLIDSDYGALLEVGRIARMSRAGFPACILPTFVFAGIFVLLLPLYGFVFFTGFLLLIAQLNSCYRSFESKR